ncbi:outer membrane beta-barrel protein [Pseudoxanthomonas suwonensis]
MKKTLALAAAVALSALSTNAVAGQPFVRAEAGHSDVEMSVGRYRGSESDTAVTIGGGYWFTQNFGIEGHIGTLYSEYLGNDFDVDLVTLGAGVVAKHNFGPDNTGFFVGARAGLARVTLQLREDHFDVVDDESSVKPYIGVTAGYDFSRRWGLSLNYDRRKADIDGVDFDIDTITFAGEIRFK